MALPTTVTSLNVSQFILNGVNLARLWQDITVKADNDLQDAAGGADVYKFYQAVKQGQMLELVNHWEPEDNTLLAGTALDVSAWSPYGTSRIADFKSGTLTVTNPTEDRSGAAAAYKYPVVQSGREIEFTSNEVISTNAAFMNTIMGGVIDNFEVVSTVSFTSGVLSGTETVEFNAIMGSGSHKISRGKIQMLDTTVKIQGVLTDPSSDDGTLLAIAAYGNALVPLWNSSNSTAGLDTGANKYGTTGTSTASEYLVIQRYSLEWSDGQLTKESITLQAQGPLTVATG